jgi:2-polyprenyl-6-methoxyphenol hydroxylase-like FAD-dependent oxidoreductase
LQNPAVDAFDQGAGLGGLACAAALGKARGYVVVDDPKNCSITFPSFYAIIQSTTKGTAVPRQDP